MEMPGGSEGPALARQGSIYSLTFDEFQSALGGASKDFGSMNMDELLRNIWTAEESNAMAAAAPTTAAASVDAHAQQQQPGAPIQRQGSFTLPRTLSQKTVDEVWREIVGLTGGEDVQPVPAPAPAPAAAAAPAPMPSQAQRQPTLGSMTLEEFLVRAGVVREDMAQQSLVLPPHAQALFSQGNAVAPQTLQLGNGLVTGVVGQGLGGAMTVAAPTTPVVLNGMGRVEAGDLSSLSPVPYPFDTALRVRKGPTVEKVVERRQRRMIKNRESAARSRARKQAYIVELEAEVAKLKEQNDELQKKQVEMLKKQKDEQLEKGSLQTTLLCSQKFLCEWFSQVLERINNQLGPKAKKLCLRRTLTGPW
ncbi:ABSCISIC ACID-INSENSITIVE 5-like protein 5 [Panicum miliaceum]|uniref:ABSCISIC ACID-INSENSITIVE 5-like protein 5 n=1 Tax=Panicum miliaceum TaxID=4540 RepID=A0A3L6S319_PANMI|nr:ABSCISIC ACID-INSENSITIVE 5-like protein 5 [Panicum miliaceum]